MKPKLTLVGAGPGDEELITLKGLRAIQTADVILYDELASIQLLDHAPKHTLKIYVGKKVGNSSFTQEEINELIVRLAKKRGNVVRLKGGDPFVFGRGHEEMVYAQQCGIECTVIPGISSAVSVPENIGIPVTRRHISESFWVITGTTKNGELSQDLYLAAQSNATVVVLMGLNKIEEICAIFSNANKSHLPVAVIQNGTKENQKFVVGQVWEINSLVNQQAIGSPAIMVFGEVVALQPAYIREYLQNEKMMA